MRAGAMQSFPPREISPDECQKRHFDRLFGRGLSGFVFNYAVTVCQTTKKRSEGGKNRA
jgi:hypothetical protein